MLRVSREPVLAPGADAIIDHSSWAAGRGWLHLLPDMNNVEK